MVAARYLRVPNRLRRARAHGIARRDALREPYFFTEGNMQNVANNFSFIAIATLGVTFVIINGIDLAVGSMMCFSAMITSMVMTELSTPGFPGASLFVHLAADGKAVLANVPGLILLVSVLAGLGVALIVGLLNGFCIAVLGLSPFVTTLGMLSIVCADSATSSPMAVAVFRAVRTPTISMR
jgi:ribose/xylose/arabinose/galactoside ABC-type transport system permease subunit